MNFHRLNKNAPKEVKVLYEELAICCGKHIPEEKYTMTIPVPMIISKKPLPNAAALLLRKLLLNITALHQNYKDEINLNTPGVFAKCVEVLCDPNIGVIPRNPQQAELFRKGIEMLKDIGNGANHNLNLIGLQDIEPVIEELHGLLGTLRYL